MTYEERIAAAQENLHELIGEAVEKKVKKEMVKVAKKLTVRFIVAGVVLLGAFTLVNKADSIAEYISKSKD